MNAAIVAQTVERVVAIQGVKLLERNGTEQTDNDKKGVEEGRSCSDSAPSFFSPTN